jgi:DNA-binding GntR family transcriptional regulator
MLEKLESGSLVQVRPKALTEWVYSILKSDILELRVSPGSQLHVEKLSERLGISRTPIREALLKLENLGLVQVCPRVGFFVADITESDMVELFEIRDWLESRATGKVASLLTKEEIVYLDNLMDATEQSVIKNDDVMFLKLEEEFHDFIIQRCGNRHLLEVIESMYNLIHRERMLSVSSRENVELTLVEHRRIVAAFHERDCQNASSMMSAHIRSAGFRLCMQLKIKLEHEKQGV